MQSAKNGTPSDQPKTKPALKSKGIIWTNDGFTVVESSVAGPDAISLALTALSADGRVALVSVDTTYALAKGGLYSIGSGEYTRLDGGDINGDGQIDIRDWHSSAAYALSGDGSVVGGSITPRWRGDRDPLSLDGSAYAAHDLGTYLRDLGASGLDGWHLSEVTGVSADGAVLSGWGYNPAGKAEPWAATIPAPGSAALLALGGFIAGRRRPLSKHTISSLMVSRHAALDPGGVFLRMNRLMQGSKPIPHVRCEIHLVVAESS
ncbi:MAG: hypothetical protein IPJ41_07165 [Phycisphaerales bacterium]|nr:hypothetical protein [Phycisphaerales bacterium]